ncbi:MAG: hypothetical protein V1792_27365 [Pseudomonadota bacterium]
MGNVKLFLDHLFFSLVSVFVAILLLSLILGGIAPDFSLGDNIWAAAAVWVVLSASLAGVLTYSSMRKRETGHIEFTRRKY